MKGTLGRDGVADFAAMLLSATSGRFATGHSQGASDAAYGRAYAHSRAMAADLSDYDLGYRVGRYVLFAAVPAWRAGMLRHDDAAAYWSRFLRSRESRPGDPASLVSGRAMIAGDIMAPDDPAAFWAIGAAFERKARI